MKTKKTVIVIGGGIHGMCSALSIAKDNSNVMILEKNSDILNGTSSATHNRAHMGYHYPRSLETAEECLAGLSVFKERFPEALSYPDESYYLIEKENSKVSADEFADFCRKMKIPYTIVRENNTLWSKKNIVCGFRVPEPIFDIGVLKKILRAEARKLRIKVVLNSELIESKILKGRYHLKVKNDQKTRKYVADALVNATYAYTNNILKILDLECDMTKYELQKTEVVTVKSSKSLPALTVSDGDFISIMPLAGAKNMYLIYDVIHSVVERTDGYHLNNDPIGNSNFTKMVSHGKKYFPFMEDLKFVKSNYGSRPIPPKSDDACRKTRLLVHKKYPHIYSILEGKFISAPLVAEELVDKMRKNKSL